MVLQQQQQWQQDTQADSQPVSQPEEPDAVEEDGLQEPTPVGKQGQ
eukprot:COSAG02_NODE_7509_length_2978_cov_2.356721_1_plen_45_part_10